MFSNSEIKLSSHKKFSILKKKIQLTDQPFQTPKTWQSCILSSCGSLNISWSLTNIWKKHLSCSRKKAIQLFRFFFLFFCSTFVYTSYFKANQAICSAMMCVKNYINFTLLLLIRLMHSSRHRKIMAKFHSASAGQWNYPFLLMLCCSLKEKR